MTLFFIAYLAALGLWIPLGIVAVLRPPLRRTLLLPILLSALGAAYESYMTFVWSPKVINPIRIDIFFAMIVLGVVDTVAGFSLFARRHEERNRGASFLAAGLCLAVPAAAVAGFLLLEVDSANVGRNLDLGRRYRFEAAFRDDATQKRFFGDLRAVKNPWAGYYIGMGEDDRFAHLVINDEGAFWIYHQALYDYPGKGQPAAAGDAFEGAGEKVMPVRMSLRRGEGDMFLLDARDSKPARMKKTNPPRFPLPSSPNDEVRFVGEFSTTYEDDGKTFWLVQVWLWESKGEWWGQYVRDHYVHGKKHDFISSEAVKPVCSNDCNILDFKSGRGEVTLTRASPDELDAKLAGVSTTVRLHRGEMLPGFMFDLAPLGTKKENQEWLKALTTAGMIGWNVP